MDSNMKNTIPAEITSEMIGTKVKDVSGMEGVIIKGSVSPLVRVAFGKDGKSVWRDLLPKYLTISTAPIPVKTAYTKGNWILKNQLQVRAGEKIIANIDPLYGDVSDENIANAKLIAAAPEMLQTLLGIRKQLNYQHEMNKASGTGKSWELELIEIDQAIFAATI